MSTCIILIKDLLISCRSRVMLPSDYGWLHVDILVVKKVVLENTNRLKLAISGEQGASG